MSSGMIWINRIGLLLDFFAFWFAAPELLGERRLRTLERIIEWGIRTIPLLVFGVSVLLAALARPPSSQAAPLVIKVLSVLSAIGLATYSLGRGIIETIAGKEWDSEMIIAWAERKRGVAWFTVVWASITVVAYATALLWVMVATLSGQMSFLEASSAGFGGVVSVVLFASFFSALCIKPVKRLLVLLVDDAQIRQRSLIVGAAMFAAGFLLQFIATF